MLVEETGSSTKKFLHSSQGELGIPWQGLPQILLWGYNSFLGSLPPLIDFKPGNLSCY